MHLKLVLLLCFLGVYNQSSSTTTTPQDPVEQAKTDVQKIQDILSSETSSIADIQKALDEESKRYAKTAQFKTIVESAISHLVSSKKLSDRAREALKELAQNKKVDFVSNARDVIFHLRSSEDSKKEIESLQRRYKELEDYSVDLEVGMPFEIQDYFSDPPYCDVVLMIDATGSMGGIIHAAKEAALSIGLKLQREWALGDHFRFGVVCFRDPVDCGGDSHSYLPFTPDAAAVVSFLNNQRAWGGCDYPEDWAGAFRIVLDTLPWRPDAHKLLILIGDAPGHGLQQYFDRHYHAQKPSITQAIRDIATRNISTTFLLVANHRPLREGVQNAKQLFMSFGLTPQIQQLDLSGRRFLESTLSDTLTDITSSAFPLPPLEILNKYRKKQTDEL